MHRHTSNGVKLLIYGDVVGKLGRAGVKLTIDEWKQKHGIDIVVANIENIAHGKGIGRSQIAELASAGVEIFTGGNHSIEGKDADIILNDETIPITRPLNMLPQTPGRGFLMFEKPTLPHPLLVINLMGQVNMKQHHNSPFYAADSALAEYGEATPWKIVDWHAEATSEKEIMGRYLDGKVSVVFGTHTHIPTADAQILPSGTGYISDIGMVGPYHSIIGVDVPSALVRFKQQVTHPPLHVVETGPIEVNAIVVELDNTGRAVDIRHLRTIIEHYTI